MQAISFRELFDHIGSRRMTFGKRAEALSGQEVELRFGIKSPLHLFARLAPLCVRKSTNYGGILMKMLRNHSRKASLIVLACMAALGAACSALPTSNEIKVTLSGTQEVPPVATSASGSGTVTIGADKAVSGSVTTSGINATAAHIHEGAQGKNGPVIVPMAKSGDSVWSIPAGAMLTDAQYQSYKNGNLYINVHSAANKGGEIRGQLAPPAGMGAKY